MELAAGSISRIIRGRTAYCHVGAWCVDACADKRLERAIFVGSAGAWVAHVGAVILLILGAFLEDQAFLLFVCITGRARKLRWAHQNYHEQERVHAIDKSKDFVNLLSGAFRTTNDAA